ncbi:MAG: ribonuclease P protein component [Frankiaceae bacterium]
MLPAKARLRRSPDFAETLKRGRRAGRTTLVVSILKGENSSPAPARVGFVVGRRVGGAVVRNRLRRRLQHLVADRRASLPPGSRTVIRALPGAERLRYADLGHELDALVARAGR